MGLRKSYTAFESICGVILIFCIFALIRIALGTAIAQQSGPEVDAFAYNRLLGRGMNLGNALEAPQEGAWGVTLKSQYFQAIKDAGFNSVRIPINWSAHALKEPPYTIDTAFFERVDWAIEQALSRDLLAVIDMHHYGEMDQDPSHNAPELLALWKQIADRYRDRPQTLVFEPFNEPQANFTDQRWNEILPGLLQTIRERNPGRMLIVGPGYWNSVDHLAMLQLPKDDRRLIVTFHYYKPMRFTHQGQNWIPESMAWKGTTWGNGQERLELHEDFEKAAEWASQQRRPIYLGEFGSSEQADDAARISWTQAVTREAGRFDFSWSYFQFCSNFGVYDTTTGTWNQPLLGALLGRN
jgi:endoglucanase